MASQLGLELGHQRQYYEGLGDRLQASMEALQPGLHDASGAGLNVPAPRLRSAASAAAHLWWGAVPAAPATATHAAFHAATAVTVLCWGLSIKRAAVAVLARAAAAAATLRGARYEPALQRLPCFTRRGVGVG